MSEQKPIRPYVVTIEYKAAVMAESAIDAYSIASGHVDEIQRDNEADVSTGHLLTSEAQLAEHGWSGDCLPYGGDGDLTLRQIFEAIEVEPMRDTKTIDMLAEQQS